MLSLHKKLFLLQGIEPGWPGFSNLSYTTPLFIDWELQIIKIPNGQYSGLLSIELHNLRILWSRILQHTMHHTLKHILEYFHSSNDTISTKWRMQKCKYFQSSCNVVCSALIYGSKDKGKTDICTLNELVYGILQCMVFYFKKVFLKMGQSRPLFLFIFVFSTCYNLNLNW